MSEPTSFPPLVNANTAEVVAKLLARKNVPLALPPAPLSPIVNESAKNPIATSGEALAVVLLPPPPVSSMPPVTPPPALVVEQVEVAIANIPWAPFNVTPLAKSFSTEEVEVNAWQLRLQFAGIKEKLLLESALSADPNIAAQRMKAFYTSGERIWRKLESDSIILEGYTEEALTALKSGVNEYRVKRLLDNIEGIKTRREESKKFVTAINDKVIGKGLLIYSPPAPVPYAVRTVDSHEEATAKNHLYHLVVLKEAFKMFFDTLKANPSTSERQAISDLNLYRTEVESMIATNERFVSQWKERIGTLEATLKTQDKQTAEFYDLSIELLTLKKTIELITKRLTELNWYRLQIDKISLRQPIEAMSYYKSKSWFGSTSPEKI